MSLLWIVDADLRIYAVLYGMWASCIRNMELVVLMFYKSIYMWGVGLIDRDIVWPGLIDVIIRILVKYGFCISDELWLTHSLHFPHKLRGGVHSLTQGGLGTAWDTVRDTSTSTGTSTSTSTSTGTSTGTEHKHKHKHRHKHHHNSQAHIQAPTQALQTPKHLPSTFQAPLSHSGCPPFLSSYLGSVGCWRLCSSLSWSWVGDCPMIWCPTHDFFEHILGNSCGTNLFSVS